MYQVRSGRCQLRERLITLWSSGARCRHRGFVQCNIASYHPPGRFEVPACLSVDCGCVTSQLVLVLSGVHVNVGNFQLVHVYM